MSGQIQASASQTAHTATSNSKTFAKTRVQIKNEQFLKVSQKKSAASGDSVALSKEAQAKYLLDSNASTTEVPGQRQADLFAKDMKSIRTAVNAYKKQEASYRATLTETATVKKVADAKVDDTTANDKAVTDKTAAKTKT